MLDAWKRDITQAARSLIRVPAFSAFAVLTLALAIGVNTATFSVVKTVLLDPLPFTKPDELVMIRGTAPGTDLPTEFGLGPEFYLEYRESARGLQDLGFVSAGQTSVRSGEHVERLFIASGPPSLFSTLDVTPVLGRLPTMEDEEGQVVVISHWLWNDWYGRDPGVIGRSIQVSGQPRTILGVMPRDFDFPSERTALWGHDVITPPVQPGAST